MRQWLWIVILLLWPSTNSWSAGFSGLLPDRSFQWNQFNSVTTVDSFAIATADLGLAVLKGPPASSKFEMIEHLFLPTPACGAKRSGNMLVVRGCYGRVHLIDITNLPQLTLLSEIDLDLSIHDVAVHDDDLYLACGFDGLRHYSLTNPSDPQFVDSSLAGVHCIQVDVVGDDLLLLDDYNGILRFDLLNNGLGAVAETLWLPRRAASFLFNSDTLTVSMASQPLLYRAVLNSTRSEILDSIALVGIPDHIYTIDTLIVTVDVENRLMDVFNTAHTAHRSYDIPEHYGELAEGDSYWSWSRPKVLIPCSGAGLMGCSFRHDGYPQSFDVASRRPGPVTSLTFHQGLLTTSGGRSKLELFDVGDNALSLPILSATSYSGADILTDAGDVLFTLEPSAERKLWSMRLNGNVVECAEGFYPYTSNFTRLLYYDQPTAYDASLLVSLQTDLVVLYSVDSDNRPVFASKAGTANEIRDVLVSDPYLLISTTERALRIYRIVSGHQLLRWWSGSSPTTIAHLTETGPRESSTGQPLPNLILAFSGNRMYEIAFDEIGIPAFRFLGTLPVEVAASALGASTLYTIGSDGFGLLDLTQEVPQMDTYGSYGGHLIACSDSTVATSDGSAVHLYSFKGESSDAPTPNGDVMVAAPAGLHQNYPNPFNPRTNIAFTLNDPARVEITIYDLLGRRITELVDRQFPAGDHTVTWEGTDRSGSRVASGVYFYRMTTPAASETRKMVLLK